MEFRVGVGERWERFSWSQRIGAREDVFVSFRVGGNAAAFVSGWHVESVRAWRMRRGGRDGVSRPRAAQMPQIAAGDSTCTAGFRGRA